MIYQLPSGRIIELSVEQFLELSDQDINDFVGLSHVYSIEVANPFFESFTKKTKVKDPELSHEVEPNLTEIDLETKRDDTYFHRDDV